MPYTLSNEVYSTIAMTPSNGAESAAQSNKMLAYAKQSKQIMTNQTLTQQEKAEQIQKLSRSIDSAGQISDDIKRLNLTETSSGQVEVKLPSTTKQKTIFGNLPAPSGELVGADMLGGRELVNGFSLLTAEIEVS